MSHHTAEELAAKLQKLYDKAHSDPFTSPDQRKTVLQTLDAVSLEFGIGSSKPRGVNVKTAKECAEKLVYFNANQAVMFTLQCSQERAAQVLESGFVASSDPKLAEKLNHSFLYFMEKSEGSVGSAFAYAWKFATQCL